MIDKIINDKEIEATIDNVIVINNCECFGMRCVKRVMIYIEILLKGIGISSHGIESSLIAAYLHDIV